MASGVAHLAPIGEENAHLESLDIGFRIAIRVDVEGMENRLASQS